MSFLGLLATLFTIGSFTVDGAKNSSYNSAREAEALCENRKTWIDSHGNTRLTATGKKVYSIGGQLIDPKTDRVIYDYNLARCTAINKEAMEEAVRDGKKYARLVYPEFHEKYYFTELSTMKRYYLYGNKYGDYEKIYYNEDQEHWYHSLDSKKTVIKISLEEFLELGGTKYSIYCHYYNGRV